MAEADNVGAALFQAGSEGEALAVVNQRHEPGFPVGIIAHEHGELAAAVEGSGAVAQELAVSPKEMFERRRT